jgi:micrococcal nuclease
MIKKRTISAVIIVIVATLFFVIPQDQGCIGDARCITGTVTEIIDGNTLKVDEQSIRFALSSAPELYDEAGVESRNYLEKICPVGSRVLVDEDDGQIMGSYGSVIGLIRCNGLILNQAIVSENHAIITPESCTISEFSDSNWAKKNGC